jgi:hypothetical protein
VADPLEAEFRRMVEHDENLLWLLEDARNHADRKPDFCAMDAWEETFKRRVADMAGHRRAYGGPDDLRTSRAYEVLSQVILRALPACRGTCACARS